MQELSLHVYDLAVNSLKAGASRICIEIRCHESDDLLTIQVTDNGAGMDSAILKKAADPFYTSRPGRSAGLGLSLFKQSAESCGGSFKLNSEPGRGTRVLGEFIYSHKDRVPLGDIGMTVGQLICLNENVEIEYTFSADTYEFSLSTREIYEALEGLALNTPIVIEEVIRLIREKMGNNNLESGRKI